MAELSDRIHELKIDRSKEPSPSRRGLWWSLALGVAIVIAGLGWFFVRAANGAVQVETETALKPAGLSASSVLDASGYVTARREATVSSQITGKIAEVLVEEGMRVEEGQVVARLVATMQEAQLALAGAEADAARASLAEIDAQLGAARLERDRLRNLAARKLTSTASLDTAEANYDALAARLNTGRENVTVALKSVAVAQQALDDMTIHAPFSGMVVSKNAQPGEMISPISAGGGFTRTGICTIVDMDSLEIEVDVNEAYIGRVKAGQKVTATLDAYPGWHIPAEVIAVVPTADRQKATVQVRIAFLERDERILRDMGVRVAFLGSDAPAGPQQEMQGVTVSGEALRTDDEGSFVWRIRDTVVERQDVRIGGAPDKDRVLVVEGLSVGDRIVRSSAEPLRAGQKIRTN